MSGRFDSALQLKEPVGRQQLPVTQEGLEDGNTLTVAPRLIAGGQTLVTLLLLGYALVTQLFPALVLSLVRPGWVTKQGAMAGIVAGVGMVGAMSFAGATPETSSTVDSLIGGLPSFLAQLNLGIVALVVNLIVMCVVSTLTRSAAPAPGSGRFERSEQVEWSASR